MTSKARSQNSNTIHAFAALSSKELKTAPVIVTFGDQSLLHSKVRKRLVRQILSEDAEFGCELLDGDEVDWRDLGDLLETASLFSQEGRVVCVQQADGLVKEYRQQLENYCASPNSNNYLILQVHSWPANTKLYKQIDRSGLQVECGLPTVRRGRSKSLDRTLLNTWIRQWAADEFGLAFDEDQSIELMSDLVDDNLGRIELELAKIALFLKGPPTPQSPSTPSSSPPTGDAALKTLTAEIVEEIVGGWRTKTVWQTAEAMAAGEAAEALALLGQLLQSGEHPLAVFGPLSWSLRRYGRALEIVDRSTRQGARPNWRRSLKQAGFNDWAGEIENAIAHLKQLGRQRTEKIYQLLAEADLACKDSHSHEERGRLVLERLAVGFSKQLANL